MARHSLVGLMAKRRCTWLIMIFSLLMTVSLLMACGKRSFDELRPGLETRGHYIENVPFFKQSEATCGPAALASVLAFWGRPESLERITAAVYLPNLGGTLPMDMEDFMRKAGFKTYSSSGTLAELKIAIKKGTPIICLLDLGFSLYHRPHYITIIGYDDLHALIICHDGSTPNRLIGYDKFRKEWARAGNWMLEIKPKTDEMHHVR
jgi:ABC-type bacteriocin/lantibiotic exporter with double-glycine peptidase domain